RNVARCGWGERAATDSPEARIENPDSRLERGVCVGDPCVARVMEVTPQRQAGQRSADAPDKLRYLRWHSGADRVGECELMRSTFGDASRQLHDAFGWDLPLDRTPDCAGEGRVRASLGCVRGGCDSEPCRHRLFGAHPLIASIERVARDDDHADLAAAGGESELETAPVEHEADIDDIRKARQRLQNFLGIGHLWDLLGIDEARRLQAPHARGEQALDQLDLDIRGDDVRLVLQPVARTDLDDFDALHGCMHWLAVSGKFLGHLTSRRLRLYTNRSRARCRARCPIPPSSMVRSPTCESLSSARSSPGPSAGSSWGTSAPRSSKSKPPGRVIRCGHGVGSGKATLR